MTDHLARIRALPVFKGPVEIDVLSGGLTNANFRVRGEGRDVMVRIGDDLPVHHVFRDREIAASRAAHAAGLSPAVVYAEPGLAVFDFVTGRTFASADVRDNRAAILDLVRRCHHEAALHYTGPAPIFWVFHVIRDYAATLRAGGSRWVPELPRFLDLGRRLEALQVPMPVVFGHHDLLPANILDDGRRLWLIDWEYGAYGTPLFDLANLAGNAEFGRDDELALLKAYFGHPPADDLVAAFDAMKAASLLREAMWSMVSEIHLAAPGADYPAYTAMNLARFETALATLEGRLP